MVSCAPGMDYAFRVYDKGEVGVNRFPAAPQVESRPGTREARRGPVCL